MFDHVADRDDDNKRASERGASGTTRRTVDVHIGDIEGERGRGGGRGLLSAWMANCIHNHGAVQSKEGGSAHVWVLIIQQMGDWKRVSNTKVHSEEVLEVEWEILQVRYQVAIVANGLLGGGLHASGDEDGPTASSFCIKRD